MPDLYKLSILLIVISFHAVSGLYIIRPLYPHIDSSNYLYNPAISPFPINFIHESTASSGATAEMPSASVPPSDYPFSYPIPSSEKRFSKQPIVIPDWMNISPY
ncbi:unnamed protein product [Auanema sp. JU1783]|nr:unnamed protein product [Auanema sp. JU1783]